ncbi:MAG: class I SAM-dependent methyltransferase [Chloroflexota bacterium]|nr:class I SAM-dependent methyltransferase [Chloroflexota bacterium]
MSMNKSVSDGWFKRRMMRLTRGEKRFVNTSANAERIARVAASLLERVTLPPEPRCLEIGCGQGAVTRLLVEQYGARVVASDYDPAQVALAQERLADLGEQVEFRVVDARAMPFDAAQFDGVFSFQVLHHIPGGPSRVQSRGWRQVVAETARVLKPGGWFVLTDIVVSPRASRLVRRLLPRLDQLEETALHTCLAEYGLRLTHYERARGILAWLMADCVAVAKLNR